MKSVAVFLLMFTAAQPQQPTTLTGKKVVGNCYIVAVDTTNKASELLCKFKGEPDYYRYFIEQKPPSTPVTLLH